MVYDKPITIQVQDPETGEWTDKLKLHAYVNKTGGGTYFNAGADQYRASLTFQVRYTKALEDALKEELTPVLWKMTRYEGVILLKLLDRETKHTAFNIVKNIRSGFTANFYQILARMFGNNLKLEYDPKGEDAMLEQIVLYYKAGLL